MGGRNILLTNHKNPLNSKNEQNYPNIMDKLTKLSQAIRLGATFHPQCFGTLFTYQRVHNCSQLLEHPLIIEASCAIGAASEALMINGRIKSEFKKRFNISEILFNEIVSKNDIERLTREQIADWLEEQGY